MASKLSKGRQAAVDVLDEQIEVLEERLKKVKPLFDELSQLKKARQVLLNENGGARSTVTKEMIEGVFAKLDADDLSVPQISDELGMNQSTVRSHLVRHEDVDYIRNSGGTWSLAEDAEEED